MTDTLTKREIVEAVYVHMKQNGRDMKLNNVKRLVDFIFAELANVLEEGQKLKIPRLGVFGVRDKKARPGRNPKTLEAKEIAARRVVTYKPSRKLKEEILAAHTKQDV